ncbi:hypothetical protein CHLNCDRAFT_140985 [Chlorella variabilis]|uniref:Serine-threonine/tyrosine-protein kinase catalytic domain-containing protein n=1 Tax=Chlorella variabilis TaxID=554065 RepID=E1ZRY2_CHLVA|nr:hypothetical protein CHLNCDRAFT_140985 [Chlorella variabilis]EFN51383.1 hypothetical protein CHLNCDRAFT_140985 [Chlorella variabilis]|eukprot:XP_005843485.1 hypothetical protein CHLNCDRAFT_140985 [Chlorella variabilis]
MLDTVVSFTLSEALAVAAAVGLFLGLFSAAALLVLLRWVEKRLVEARPGGDSRPPRHAEPTANAAARRRGEQPPPPPLAGGTVQQQQQQPPPPPDGGRREQQQQQPPPPPYGGGEQPPLSHMPLELIQGQRLGRATDAFAFGVLLWEMYCGERAWAGKSAVQILYARTAKHQRLAVPADCPAGYKASRCRRFCADSSGQFRCAVALAEACLDDDPKRRPSFDQIAATLAGLAREG